MTPQRETRLAALYGLDKGDWVYLAIASVRCLAMGVAGFATYHSTVWTGTATQDSVFDVAFRMAPRWMWFATLIAIGLVAGGAFVFDSLPPRSEWKARIALVACATVSFGLGLAVVLGLSEGRGLFVAILLLAAAAKDTLMAVRPSAFYSGWRRRGPR